MLELLPTAVLSVADPRKGKGVPEAFVFWICVLCIVATFILAFTGKLNAEAGVFASGTSLILGYYLGGQVPKKIE